MEAGSGTQGSGTVEILGAGGPPCLSAVGSGELSELGAVPPAGPGSTRFSPGSPAQADACSWGQGWVWTRSACAAQSREHESPRRPCGDASASTSHFFVCRAPCRPPGPPCVSVGPPGARGGAGSLPCTFTWGPGVTVPPKSAVEACPIFLTSTLATVVLNSRLPENRQNHPLHSQPHTHRGWSGQWKWMPFPGCLWSLFPASGTWGHGGLETGC